MEGVIIGFDEYMNLVLDDAVEVKTKTNARRPCGMLLFYKDNFLAWKVYIYIWWFGERIVVVSVSALLVKSY